MSSFFMATAAAHDLDAEVAYLAPPSVPAPEPAPAPAPALVPVPVPAPVAPAPVPASVERPDQISLKLDEPLDACDVAYDLTMSWVKPEEWKAKVKSVKSKFDDWEAQTDGDMCRYLNDRLISVAMSCSGGKIEELKNGFAFLALYKEFNLQAPGLIEKIFREHRDSLLKLFSEFTWQRASEYVKNKEWRRDMPAAKKNTGNEKAR